MLQTIIAGQTLFHQHSIREFPDELLARIVLTRVSDLPDVGALARWLSREPESRVKSRDRWQKRRRMVAACLKELLAVSNEL